MRRIIFATILLLSSTLNAQKYWPSDSQTIDGLNLEAVAEIYTVALQDLYEKSLVEVPAEKLTSQAIRGFAQFLPNIRATVAGSRVMLEARGKVIGNFPAPDDKNDMNAWGHLIATMLLNIRHYDKELVSSHPEQLYYSTLTSLASVVDPYAQYIYPKKAFTKTGSAKLISTSIGISYRRDKNKNIQVLSVFENSPAFLKGMADGDTITKINGKNVTSMYDEEVETAFHGKTNAFVQLSYIDFVSRKTKDVTLRRASFISSPIDLKILPGGFAQIIIHDFSINTKELVQEAIVHAYNSNDELYGVILDLRGNSGGLLEQAVEIADMFLDSGVIAQTKGRHKSANNVYKAKKGDLINGRPMVVLVDQTTASAAEILALSLQQLGRAVVIGTPTFGKGAVQTASDLPNGAKLIFTWAEVYDREGNFLDKRGVLPVICTSSIKDLQAQYDMVENIKSKRFNSPVLQWQYLPAEKMDEIQKIRQGCKPSDLSEDNIAFTQSLALSILGDKELYKKLMSIQVKGE